MAGQKRHPMVEEQVDYLLALAKKTVKEDRALAKKYVRSARLLAMRKRVPIGGKRKALFCRSCLLPWIAGYNVKIRLLRGEGKISYLCACGKKYGRKYRK